MDRGKTAHLCEYAASLGTVHFKSQVGASLVVQWLGIRLTMQRVRVRSLVWELRFHELRSN